MNLVEVTAGAVIPPATVQDPKAPGVEYSLVLQKETVTLIELPSGEQLPVPNLTKVLANPLDVRQPE